MAQINYSDSTLIPVKGNRTVNLAWYISFFAAITIIAALLVFKPDPFQNIVVFVSDGILRTFQITLISMCCALVVGFVVGLGQISRIRALNVVSTVYVEVIRGIPLLVQLVYLYYGLGRLLAVNEITAAIIAISICYGAYLSEIFRAGIVSIPKGQMEAALALGLSRGQAIIHIIIPQTFRVILPPIGNEFIALLKDSSLVSILAVSDLLRRGREFASVSFEYFETYSMVALIYLVITLFLSKLVGILEDKLG